MSLTRHISTILTEQISEKKREALYNLFLKVFDVYKRKSDWAIRAFDAVLELDPTPNNQYTQWLIVKGLKDKYGDYSYDDNGYFLELYSLKEDAPRITNALKTHFEKKKADNFPKEYVDINKVKNISQLEDIIRPFDVSTSIYQRPFEEILEDSNATVGVDYWHIYKSKELDLYIPRTELGACVLGAQTEWCTTWGEQSLNPKFSKRSSRFDVDEGDLLIMRLKNQTPNTNSEMPYYGSMYQMQISSDQIMDEKDNSVKIIDIYEKLQSPKSKQAISDWIIGNMTDDLSNNILSDNFGDIILAFQDQQEMIDKIHYVIYTLDESSNNEFVINHFDFIIKAVSSDENILKDIIMRIRYGNLGEDILFEFFSNNEVKTILDSYLNEEFKKELYMELIDGMIGGFIDWELNSDGTVDIVFEDLFELIKGGTRNMKMELDSLKRVINEHNKELFRLDIDYKKDIPNEVHELVRENLAEYFRYYDIDIGHSYKDIMKMNHSDILNIFFSPTFFSADGRTSPKINLKVVHILKYIVGEHYRRAFYEELKEVTKLITMENFDLGDKYNGFGNVDDVIEENNDGSFTVHYGDVDFKFVSLLYSGDAQNFHFNYNSPQSKSVKMYSMLKDRLFLERIDWGNVYTDLKEAYEQFLWVGGRHTKVVSKKNK
jgi:hypothetical protein